MRVVTALRSYARSSSIGFIGMGQIGRPMASALMSKSKDCRIVLFDVSARTTATVIEEQIQQGGFKVLTLLGSLSNAQERVYSKDKSSLLHHLQKSPSFQEQS